MAIELKPEVLRVLDREHRLCVAAISRLREKTGPLEEQYGWSTDTFVAKFDAGEIGDAHAFFRWYAWAQALEDWQQTRASLAELLPAAELAGG